LGNKALAITKQKEALTALLKTISETNLSIPTKIPELMQPPADGYPRTRESFNTKTYFSFDEVAAKEAAIDQLMDYLLHPVRLNRIQQQQWGSNNYLKTIHDDLNLNVTTNGNHAANIGHYIFMMKLTSLIQDDQLHFGVKAEINKLLNSYLQAKKYDTSAHHAMLRRTIQTYFENPALVPKRVEVPLPPGAPIGCDTFQDGQNEEK
jgi:hypothetical protein